MAGEGVCTGGRLGRRRGRAAALGGLLAACALAAANLSAVAAPRIAQILYTVQVDPAREGAQVVLELEQPRDLLRELRFHIHPQHQQGFAGDGQVTQGGEYVTWVPPARGGKLSWFTRLSSERDDGALDGVVARDWAVFRGDDLVPPAAVRKLKRTETHVRLRFVLPRGWSSITPYPRDSKGAYLVVNAQRSFDRPTGWMALGRLAVKWGTIAGTRVAVASPRDAGVRHQDLLAFLRWTLPELRSLFPLFGARLLIVGAGDPMWRGGLSAPASIYLHADRPLISQNGTSTLAHELVHVAMRVQARRGADWVVEAFAELYSLEILLRSGTISQRHYDEALEQLAKWGAPVRDLFQRHSNGPTTARGVGVLKALDAELRERTQGRHDLDDVARAVAGAGTITFVELRRIAEDLAGGPLKSLAARNVPGLK